MRRLLQWIAPLVATVALFALPALRFSAPMMPVNQWSVAQLGTSLAKGHSNYGSMLHQAQTLRQSFSSGAASSAGADWTLVLGWMIPVAALLAGVAALLSWLWLSWGKPRAFLINAVVGLVAAGYAVGASWWLTRAARLEVAHAMARAQNSFGSLMGKMDWTGLAQGMAAQLSLSAEAGLYVMILAFLAMLVWPLGEGSTVRQAGRSAQPSGGPRQSIEAD